MEITRTTARKMGREKEMRWKKYRERERNRAWAGGRREKKRGENFFWQMSFDENNIRKNHVKTSKENDKSSF